MMWKLKHLWRRFKQMDFKGLWKTARRVARRSKKLTVFILIDMIICSLKYGSGYSEYAMYEFETLNAVDRNKFMMLTSGHAYYLRYNKKEDRYILDDKTAFIEKFPEFTKRNTMDLRNTNFEDFERFVSKNPVIMVKTIDDYVGNGIERIDLRNRSDIKEVFEKIKQNKQYLVEEYLQQHSKLNALHPDSVNSVRVITFLREDGSVAIINIAQKVGNGSNVDNMAKGGLYGVANMNGVVEGPFVNKMSEIFTHHPITNEKLIGFEIPNFDMVIDMAVKAAKALPTLRYVGWDIAILENRVVILEGNSLPSFFQATPKATRYIHAPIHDLKGIYLKEMK